VAALDAFSTRNEIEVEIIVFVQAMVGDEKHNWLKLKYFNFQQITLVLKAT
jgi:hypothetical protein